MIKIKHSDCSLSSFERLSIEGWINNFDKVGIDNWHDAHRQDNHKYYGLCGETLELLCDPTSMPNSDKGADLGGILECKTRVLPTTSKLSLFTQSPSERFISKEDMCSLVTPNSADMKCNRIAPKQQELGLQMKVTKKNIIVSQENLGKLYSWDLERVLDAYKTKFKNVLACDAIKKVEHGKLKFKYIKVNLHLSVNTDKFIEMFRQGLIVLQSHTQWGSFFFRITHPYSHKLFGEAISIK